jgi:hypothetical protein
MDLNDNIHILLAGVEGSAKSAVLSLTDQIEKTAVIPVHDKIAFGSNGNECFMKDIREIRHYLSKTNYAAIELLTEDQIIEAYLGTSQDSVVSVPFNFKFSDFEIQWKTRALKLLPVSNYTLVDIIYEELWHSLTGTKSVRRFIYMSTKSPMDAINFSKNQKSKKIIFVDRRFLSCAWVINSRKLKHNVNVNRNSKLLLLKRNILFIFRVMKYRYQMFKFGRTNPSLYLKINFEDLISEPIVAMNKIYEFIEVKELPTLEVKPSWLGVNLQKNGTDYISQDVARIELEIWIESRVGVFITKLLKKAGVL